MLLRDAFKKNKCNICYIASDPLPSPLNVTKNMMYFFKKLDQYWGTFAPQKGQNTSLIAKIGEKWLKSIK